MNNITKYFNWLQKNNPVGEVEKYPEIDANGETSVKGIYIVGDLTGIPLLKLAAESGKETINRILADEKFKKQKTSNNNQDVFDIVIIGAGPAGIAAGLEAQKQNLNFIILESTKKFSTIINFPKGKPIYAEPTDYEQKSDLKISDGIKESLLEELESQIQDKHLPITEGTYVTKIEDENNVFSVITDKKNYKALRVIIAIGKSGNSRTLDVPGEEFPKVFNRLFDPTDAKDKDVLVVGGGDSALETAILTSEYAKSVSISYRKPSFARAKEGNADKVKRLVEQNKVKLLMETNVNEIKEDRVIIESSDKEKIELKNDIVFTMIGRELPTEFFNKSNIKMEGELSLISKLQFLLLIFVSGVIYFGKSSADLYKYTLGEKVDSFGDFFNQLFTIEFWGKFISLPAYLLETLTSDSIRIWSVTKYINAFVAYIALIGALILGSYLLLNFLKNYKDKFALNWQTFKYAYYIFIAIFFSYVFFGGRYFGIEVFGKSQSFWYTAFYSVTILVFGLRRIHVKPTRYIKYQTWSLILIQALPLFILPEFVFPFLGKIGALGGENGFVFTQVFPNQSYWRSYGFVLAWPLNFSNLYNGNITTFWLIFSLLQTFVFIPAIVYKWGKGAYCGWICSCGALAETLGDEYRTLAPHGAKAKKWENIGQWVLLAAFIITGLKLISILYKIEIPIINENISYTADFFQKFYYIGIDVIFAGVLGVGVYFFLSGRVWCRFGCPLAALMHIYSRFSKYRIFSEKKKCISCNICTKVC
ncbi:MAG: NAD(P)-binding domain-containing protein, partial [Ignavibacteriae bacterium]|nr:NAD(P)-binding domain-containing protein [Ignavibacteriota bacterium]